MSQPAIPGRLSREDPELSERHRHVFAALVALHCRSARAVGSEALAHESGMPLSPASIRNALAELEEMGLLDRAHASAGRVPSTAGYELFVRALLTPAALPRELQNEVDERLQYSTRDVEHLLGEASRVLSSLTRQLGLALAASLEDEHLGGLELAPLDQRRTLLVLTLGAGAVRTLALQLESPLDRGELEEVAAVLRQRLLGRSLREMRERLSADPELARDSAVRIVVRAAAASWADPVATPLFSSGAMNIAEQPEFARGLQLGPVLRAVEGGAPLDRLMVSGVEGHVAVRVGVDEVSALAACSLVSFPLPGTVPGAVGVLGPLRMDYARALAVVDAVGRRVAELLQTRGLQNE